MATKNVSAVVEATSVWPVDEELGWIGGVHRRTDAALGYGLRPQEAAVVRGMVLGDRSLIQQDLEVDFRRSGITHASAILGFSASVTKERTLGALSLRTAQGEVRAAYGLGSRKCASTTFAEQDKTGNTYDDAAFRSFGYHRCEERRTGGARAWMSGGRTTPSRSRRLT